jgi:hypothetical protein
VPLWSHQDQEDLPVKEELIIGVELAKRVFKLHGAAAEGAVAFRKKLLRKRVPRLHAAASKMQGGDGGMRDGP